MWWSRRFAATVLLALLAGCGFEPLYGLSGRSEPSVVAALAGVHVAPIPDRIGQQLRNDLLHRLTPGGTSAKPDIELSAQTLGAVYLGGHRFTELMRAGLIQGDAAALATADRMFSWDRQPWCPEVF